MATTVSPPTTTTMRRRSTAPRWSASSDGSPATAGRTFAMRITDVTTEAYSWPCPPIRNGKYVYTTAGLGLVKVHTDDCITGVGLGDGGELGRAVVAMIKPHLVGADPFDVERLWHAM